MSLIHKWLEQQTLGKLREDNFSLRQHHLHQVLRVFLSLL